VVAAGGCAAELSAGFAGAPKLKPPVAGFCPKRPLPG
jgi:hypothetical protein